MTLKQIIKRKKLFNYAFLSELEIPGDPLIYSIKYELDFRFRGLRSFRNKACRSIVKSFFPSYRMRSKPVVVFVRFYVKPEKHADVSSEQLRKETTPAVFAPELCDYLLSFLEILWRVLFTSYEQIVKIDTEKYYSSNPRTVIQFMSWENYLAVQNHFSLEPKAEIKRKNPRNKVLQSVGRGDEKDEKLREDSDQRRT